MNRKLKEIKTDYETKLNEVNQKIAETNKKCDILFEMIQETHQNQSFQQPVSSLRRRKIVSSVLPDNFEVPEIIPQMSSQHYTQNIPQNTKLSPNTKQSKISSTPKAQTQVQAHVATPPAPQQQTQKSETPFDLFSNIINIIEIAKPSQQPVSEPKIEIVDETEEDVDIDEEIKEELDSLLEDDNNEEN
jgi:hypothetical protein